MFEYLDCLVVELNNMNTSNHLKSQPKSGVSGITNTKEPYHAIHSLRQTPHNALKCQQSHRIRRKCSQKTRQKPPPESPRAILSPYLLCSILPSRKTSFSIVQGPTEGVGHYSLLYNVGGVGGEPEDLGGETTGPEVYGGSGEIGGGGEEAGEDVVGAPPEEEEGAEDEGCGEAVVEACDAVGAELESGAS